MAQSGITEDEVLQCMMHGLLEIRQVVGSETRYGKKLSLKDKTIIVTFTLRNNKNA